MVYDHRETVIYTNGVRTLGSVREGTRALMTVGSGKMCVRIKIPLEMAQECGNRYTQNPELVRNCMSRQILTGKPDSRWICREVSEG